MRLRLFVLLLSLATSGAAAQDPPGLGFAFRPTTSGLLVQALADDGPASGAGLLEADLVTAVAGMRMPGLAPEAIADWMRTVGGSGIPIILDVTRDGGATQVTIVPAPYSRQRLATKLEERTADLIRRTNEALASFPLPDLDSSSPTDAPSPEARALECDEIVPLTRAFSTEAVRCALASGADPNAKDSDGWAPLHTAVNRSDEAAIQLLADAGAAIDVLDSRGGSILHHAVVYAGATPEAIRRLVDLGASLTATDENGTPLHSAARFDAAEAARALLEAGADPNALTPDEYAQTPLHAAFLGSVDAAVLPVLLKYGADPTIRDGYGQSPLDIALEAADSEYTNFGDAIVTLRVALGE